MNQMRQAADDIRGCAHAAAGCGCLLFVVGIGLLLLAFVMQVVVQAG